MKNEKMNIVEQLQADFKTRDTLTDIEFDSIMECGMKQALRDESSSVEEVIGSLKSKNQR